MMTLAKVEHILRAAGEATGQKSFVLIGSAALFVWVAAVPKTLAMSREADIYALLPDVDAVELISDELDAILGQASPFDQQFGYYCDGVGPRTAILPDDWMTRARTYSSANTGGVSAIAPEPNDLALSKLCAGRAKDMAWLRAALKARLISLSIMRVRMETISRFDRDILTARLDLLQASPGDDR